MTSQVDSCHAPVVVTQDFRGCVGTVVLAPHTLSVARGGGVRHQNGNYCNVTSRASILLFSMFIPLRWAWECSHCALRLVEWCFWSSWCSVQMEDGSWRTQTERLLLMDSRDFNLVGIGARPLAHWVFAI